jgi:hypothetical protein
MACCFCCGCVRQKLALFDVFASWVMSASGGSGHWSADRVEFWANAVGAAPPTRRVALYLARTSDRSTEPASGLGPFRSRSLRQERRRAYGTPASITQTIRTGALSRLHAAPWQPHQLISGRAPVARTKILHARGSSAPRWMGLVSRTADKANPASSVTHPSRLWPGSVGQTH